MTALPDFGPFASAASRPAPHRQRKTSTAALSTASQRGERTSDAPCRAPREPGDPSHSGEPGPARPSARQSDTNGADPERLPSTGAPRVALTTSCCKGPSPPRSFATALRLPAHVRRPTLSRGPARPTAARSCSLRTPDGQAPPVDFCNRTRRRARPAADSDPAHRAWDRSRDQLCPNACAFAPTGGTSFDGAAPPPSRATIP